MKKNTDRFRRSRDQSQSDGEITYLESYVTIVLEDTKQTKGGKTTTPDR